MKLKLLLSVMLGAAMLSCSSNASQEQKDEAQAKEMDQLSLVGKWRLADFPSNTGDVVVCDSTENYYLEFNEQEHSFNMTTDCNSIFGQYKLAGDSLTFDNLGSTKMMCPDTKVEDNMNQMFQRVDTYLITPDSTLLLKGDARIFATFKYVNE